MIELTLNKALIGSSGVLNLDMHFQIERGQFVTLYGPSGAGKTSTLRMIAGLMEPENGKIIVNENVWYDSSKNISLSIQKRNVGFVFQEYALFPNMTVLGNLKFAMRKGEDITFVNELIDIIALRELENRKPSSLSGGQKQRVALARALIQKPELLMLDEPLSALDRGMRMNLQDYLLNLHNKYNLTTILVSHDISEIFKLSNKVIVLNNGKIEKQGAPQDIFGDRAISGKFQFTGEVIKIEKQNFLIIVSVLIGNDLVRVIADEHEIEGLQLGEKVLVASKAFNPVIRRI